jgi:glycosyltransferase involved in cell wall biosynthesis
MDKFPEYDFECILADNGSTDHTQDVLRAIAAKDVRFKIVINTRNFGSARSQYNIFKRASGDAYINVMSDLQTPIECIINFIQYWEKGYKIVIGVREKSKENPLMYLVRRVYYRIVKKISDVDTIEHFMGFALYDAEVLNILRSQDWPAPYTRGLVSEIGIDRAVVRYTQPKRKSGKSSYSFLRYFDLAMQGITTSSNVPLRLTTLLGAVCSVICLLVALVYLIIKLINWNSFSAGMAPLLIGLFLIASVQIFCIGIVGEYVLQIFIHINKKPLVVEKELINFSGEENHLNLAFDQSRYRK